MIKMERYLLGLNGDIVELNKQMQDLLENYLIPERLGMFYVCSNKAIEDSDGPVLILVSVDNNICAETNEEIGFLETIYSNLVEHSSNLQGLGWFSDDYLRCYYRGKFYRFVLKEPEPYECFVQIYDNPPPNRRLLETQILLSKQIESYKTSLDGKIDTILRMVSQHRQSTLIGRLDFLSALLKVDGIQAQVGLSSSG